MSDTDETTTHLKLPYLDPSQAQPEVKINLAWDILDNSMKPLSVKHEGDSPTQDVDQVTTIKFAGSGVASVEFETPNTAVVTIEGGGSGSDTGTALTVEEAGDSPAQRILDVATLRFEGAKVESETAGVARVIISAVPLTVQDFGESPGRTVTNVDTIRFEGATVTEESGSVALVTLPTPIPGPPGSAGAQQPPGAAWVSITFGTAIAVPVNAVPRLINSTFNILRCVVLTEGGPGSCVINVWKLNLGTGYPPTSANDITGGNNVVLSAASSHNDATLTGWTTALVAQDVLLFSLASCSNFSYVQIQLVIG